MIIIIRVFQIRAAFLFIIEVSTPEPRDNKILKKGGKKETKIDKIAEGNIKKIKIWKSNKEAIEEINKIKKENDCILLKASNGMHFGEILEGIKN